MQTIHGKPDTFSVKPKWQTVIFCFSPCALRLKHICVRAPSRTLHGRGSKALWRFHGNLVACAQGVHRQLFSTPLHICMCVCARIFVGFNICGFRRSAAICDNFVHKSLDILWKGVAGQINGIIDINMATIYLSTFVTERFVPAGGEACLFILILGPQGKASRFVTPPSIAVAVQKELEGTTHAP